MHRSSWWRQAVREAVRDTVRALRRAVAIAWVLAIVLTLASAPGLANAPEVPTTATAPRITAPVVLDGRKLFELEAAGNFSARDRAARVEARLEAALEDLLAANVSNGVAIDISTENVAGNQTIHINGSQLMTVTERDIDPLSTTTDQAEEWRALVEKKLRQAIFERSPEYIRDKREAAFKGLGFAVALYLCSWELDAILRRPSQTEEDERAESGSPATSSPTPRSKPRQTLLHLLLVAGQVSVWTIAAYYITGLFPQSRQWRYDFIANFTRPILLLGDRNSSILDLVLLLAMLVGLWFAVIWLTDRFRTQVLSVTGADRGIQDITIVFSRCVLLFVGLSIVLQVWGIDLASLAVLLSALSVGIGFGLQNIANNFISGIIISFDRSMKVGDFVQLDDLMGTVERIGARSIEIRTPDYVSIVVPNSRFLEQALVNWSHGNPVSRIGIPVGVAYGTDSEQVREALLEVARGYEPLLLAPEPQVWFRGFGDSSLDFELLVWIRDPQNQFRYANELNYRVYDALARYDIEIPFPQRDIHIRSQPESSDR